MLLETVKLSKKFLQSTTLWSVDENYSAFKIYIEEVLDKQTPFNPIKHGL